MTHLTPLIEPYPYERDIMSQNTRCEIAEGVAFSNDLGFPMDSPTRIAINDLVHHYLKHIFGEPTHD